MQKGHAKIYIDPVQLLNTGKLLKGQIELSRLGDFLVRVDNAKNSDNEQQICSYSLNASIGESGRVCIMGTLRSTLVMTCQRCLYSVDVNVENSFVLYPVLNKDIESLTKGLDPLVLTSKGDFVLNDLICDELLLMVPYAPKHKDCDVKS